MKYIKGYMVTVVLTVATTLSVMIVPFVEGGAVFFISVMGMPLFSGLI